jgi:hypothetical protein
MGLSGVWACGAGRISSGRAGVRAADAGEWVCASEIKLRCPLPFCTSTERARSDRSLAGAAVIGERAREGEKAAVRAYAEGTDYRLGCVAGRICGAHRIPRRYQGKSGVE